MATGELLGYRDGKPVWDDEGRETEDSTTPRPAHTPTPWGWTDDGYGDDVEPAEPGKRWLTIAPIDEEGYVDGEIAIIVNRFGDPTPGQAADAAFIIESVNGYAALQGRLEAAEAALRDSEDARARLDAALRLVERGSIDHRGDHFCSRCGGYIKEGHRSECEVGSALVERCDYCNHPVHFYRCEVSQCDCPSDDGGD